MIKDDSHHDMLLDAIGAVDAKVDALASSVQGVVKAFEAFSGAMKTVETAGKIAKPLLWIISLTAFFLSSWHYVTDWFTAHFHR
jgi:hypothetical protein